ncbi:MAG: hypothetical protein ACM3QY_08180 [Candidatus Levyibacteriota bacterium]
MGGVAAAWMFVVGLALAGAAGTSGAATPVIGAGFSGAWYDPQQSGHGLFLEVLPGNKLLAWWFAFTPDGTQQSWFGGVGTISGNTATVPVALTQGGRWIPNFDPSKVVGVPWGTLAFTFSDCNNGRVDFTSSFPGYGSSSMTLVRLTLLAGLSCSDAVGSSAMAAQGMWTGTTSLGESVRAFILDDGTYYILYSDPRGARDAGVLQGSATASGGQFTSSDGMDFPIAVAAETLDSAKPVAIGGSYVAKTTLQLNIVEGTVSRSLTASYDASYDQPASLAAAAGSYTGYTGHAGGALNATFALDSSGRLSGENSACAFAGTVTPHGTANVFDFTVAAVGGGLCIFGHGPISGMLYYDAVSRQIHAFTPFHERADEWYLIGTRQ